MAARRVAAAWYWSDASMAPAIRCVDKIRAAVKALCEAIVTAGCRDVLTRATGASPDCEAIAAVTYRGPPPEVRNRISDI